MISTLGHEGEGGNTSSRWIRFGRMTSVPPSWHRHLPWVSRCPENQRDHHCYRMSSWDNNVVVSLSLFTLWLQFHKWHNLFTCMKTSWPTNDWIPYLSQLQRAWRQEERWELLTSLLKWVMICRLYQLLYRCEAVKLSNSGKHACIYSVRSGGFPKYRTSSFLSCITQDGYFNFHMSFFSPVPILQFFTTLMYYL